MNDTNFTISVKNLNLRTTETQIKHQITLPNCTGILLLAVLSRDWRVLALSFGSHHSCSLLERWK